MRKSLLYSVLMIVVSILLIGSLHSQRSLITPGDRSLDISQSVEADLYHSALYQFDHYEELLQRDKMAMLKITSLLNTRYPELAYEVETAPQQVLSQPMIAKMILAIVKQETTSGISSTSDGLAASLSKEALDPNALATLEFLYAYELFRAKRLNEADKIWQKLLKSRRGDYEYAAYYAGLTAIIQGRHSDAISTLTLVGKTDHLAPHIPYYLAAAHYGNEDYSKVVQYYRPRVDESQLHNISGLTKIVGFALYKTEQYADCVTVMQKLDLYRDLSDEESYVLSMALSKTGQRDAANDILANVAQGEGDLKINAAYQYALQLSEQGKYVEAHGAFEKMIGNRAYNQADVTYNLAILSGKLGKYDMVAHHALQLSSTNHKDKVADLLSDVLDNVDNPSLYRQIVLSMKKDKESHKVLKTSLYQRGVDALQQRNFDLANEYFGLLGEVDPLIEERGAVAAWKGIMAFQAKDYKTARRLLSNYLNSKSQTEAASKLQFDANYFLAYSHFKLQEHNPSLGYFAEALNQYKKTEATLPLKDKRDIEEDLYLRIGDNYFLLDNYADAYKSYDEVVSINSMYRPYALWQQAVIAELQNNPYDQILLLEDIISNHQTTKYYNKAMFSAANTLFSLQKYSKAATLYQQIMNQDVPQRMKEESTVQLGLIAFNAGDYDRAASYYNAIADNTKDLEMKQRSQLALKEIYADYAYDPDAYLEVVSKSTPADESVELDKALYDLAMNTYETGGYLKAIDQWNKMITDFPESRFIDNAWLHIAKSYEAEKKWQNAIDAYVNILNTSNTELKKDAEQRVIDLSYNELKDYNQYLQVRKRSIAPMTASLAYNDAVALLHTGDVKGSAALFNTIYSSTEVNPKNKTTLLTDVTQELMKQREWKSIAAMDENISIKSIIDASPKHIYYRALALTNLRELANAAEAITDNYTTLLDDPAWLAKSIILLSDVYVLQGDIDNAEAALQALVETDSQVPPSLIQVAKNRLENLVHVAN